MKDYHYKSDGNNPLTHALKDMDQEGAERIENLKKQITHLKNCLWN
jgi:hypothetical protein